MKKILLMVFVIAGISFSQSWTKVESDRALVVNKIEAWSGFTSDSNATLYTKPFDISAFDTVEVWGYGTSTNGSVKYVAGFFGGFTNSNVSATVLWDSLGSAMDSTTSKNEHLDKVGRISTGGAVYGRVIVYGNAAVPTGSAINRADTKLYIYVVGRKRGYTQISN